LVLRLVAGDRRRQHRAGRGGQDRQDHGAGKQVAPARAAAGITQGAGEKRRAGEATRGQRHAERHPRQGAERGEDERAGPEPGQPHDQAHEQVVARIGRSGAQQTQAAHAPRCQSRGHQDEDQERRHRAAGRYAAQ
jgi:hypothetical protein